MTADRLRDALQPTRLVLAACLGGVLLLLGLTGVAAWRAARSPQADEGLTYATLGADLRAAFRLVPVQRWVRVDTVAVRLADGVRVVDTLVPIADRVRYPAFRRGGFLDDQVRLFNRHQRFRIEVGRHSASGFDSLAALNPSIFRTGRSERGAPIVLEIANVHPMRVPSPFEELWRGRVLATGGGEVPALASREAGLTRLDAAREAVASPCRVERAAELVRFFCASRERRPQLVVRLAADESRGTARVGWAPRGSPFRYDGAPARAGDTIPFLGGGIVSMAGLAPSVFARVEPALVSGTQWINGRVRRVSAAPRGLEFLEALGTRAAAGGARGGRDATLALSVDAALSRALGDSLAAATRGLPLDGAAVVLADARTGEVIAMAEAGPTPAAGAGWLTRPLSVGSVVKPVVAAAALSERPELASLEVPAREQVTELFGHPVGRFESRLNCGMPVGGWIDLAYFIRCSSNQYAGALTLAALARESAGGWLVLERGPTSPFRLGGRTFTDRRPALPLARGAVPRDELTGSALATGLLRAFNVDADIAVADARSRDATLFAGLRYQDGTPVRPPRALLPEVSRPSLVAREEGGTSPALLATYGFGGWGNQWTLLDLTQAYARILADRRVVLSLVPGGLREGNDPTNPAEIFGRPLGWGTEAWYRTLTDALRNVAETGTADGLAERWRAAIGGDVDVYAKTGTLNEQDERLYLRSIAFGVGWRDARRGAALRCGVVGIVYFKLRALPEGASMVPPLHTTFASGPLASLLARRWASASPCAAAGGPVAQR